MIKFRLLTRSNLFYEIIVILLIKVAIIIGIRKFFFSHPIKPTSSQFADVIFGKEGTVGKEGKETSTFTKSLKEPFKEQIKGPITE